MKSTEKFYTKMYKMFSVKIKIYFRWKQNKVTYLRPKIGTVILSKMPSHISREWKYKKISVEI